MPVQLTVVTPQGIVVDTRADSIVAPGSEGEFGVLPGHEAFLAPLAPGELRYDADGRTHHVRVTGGFAEVTHGYVSVLAPSAEPVDA